MRMKENCKIRYYWSKFFSRLHGAAVKDSTLHPTASVSSGCNIIGCSIGRCSYLGVDSWAINAVIGQYCSIADRVYIGGAEHPMHWLSTSPVFQDVKRSSSKIHYAKHQWNPKGDIVIGDDVWIGYGAIILSGIHIGQGAIIGAGSVVTKDVPPYAVVGGVPAKVLKYRFDEASINELERLQWWNLDDESLKILSKNMEMNKDLLSVLKNLADANNLDSDWGGENSCILTTCSNWLDVTNMSNFKFAA